MAEPVELAVCCRGSSFCAASLIMSSFFFFSREICFTIIVVCSFLCLFVCFSFFKAHERFFTSSKVFLEGHKHSSEKVQLALLESSDSLLESTLREQKLRRLLTRYLEVRRWVPDCLAFQYQGGLRALRKLKQLSGERFPWF